MRGKTEPETPGNARNNRRRDRIRLEIPLADLMNELGYNVHSGGGGEEQFCCDLHGDGHDNKPSARLYPNNTTYCWACSVARDAVSYVRAKKGLEYTAALDWLEKEYKLPSLPFEDDDYSTKVNLYPDPVERDDTFEGVTDRVRKQLDRFTVEKTLPLNTLLGFWGDFDRILYLVVEKVQDERSGMRNLLLLRERVVKA